VSAVLLTASVALAQPTVTTSVVSGDPAAPNATFDVLVSISGSPTTGSVEAINFKAVFDSRKVSLVAASYVAPPSFGGLEDPVIIKPVNEADPSYSAPDDPSPDAFRHVAAADLFATNTLTDGSLVLLTFETSAWPSAPLGIGLMNPAPVYTIDEPPLAYQLIGGDPADLWGEYAPIFDNSATLNIGAPDTDGDRIPDFAEFFAPAPTDTNLNIADSDGDGLLDSDDIEAGTNPRNRDTDGDGLYDSFEIVLGTDPVGVMNTVVDADNDGLPASALDDGGNPLDLSPLGGADPNDGNVDTDGDGFADGYEAIVFADSTAADDPGRVPVLGDVNNSGGAFPINALDALICLRLVGGAITLTHPAIVNRQAFDMNRDGQINTVDALIMLRRAGGSANTAILPVPNK